MRGVDTNILVFADRDETPQHRKALQVLRELATGSEPWVLPWPCIYEFLRVVTHPRVFHPPTRLDEAWRAVESLLDSPSRVRLAEGGATGRFWLSFSAPPHPRATCCMTPTSQPHQALDFCERRVHAPDWLATWPRDPATESRVDSC